MRSTVPLRCWKVAFIGTKLFPLNSVHTSLVGIARDDAIDEKGRDRRLQILSHPRSITFPK
jgi:hypothetical protein